MTEGTDHRVRAWSAGRVALLAVWMTAAGLAARALAANVDGPRIVCDKPVHNFGVVRREMTVTNTFFVRNAGNGELRIQRVRTTCGCTTAKLTSYTIPAGGTVGVEAQLSLAGRHGKQDKSIFIESNDPVSPNYQLQITGEIRREIEAIPERVFFNLTEGDAAAEQTVQILADTPQAVQLEIVETNRNPVCSASLEPVEPGKRYNLTVRMVRAPDRAGFFTETIVLRSHLASQPEVLVPVMVSMQKEVTVVPSVLLILQDAGGEPPPFRDLFVRSARNRPLTVLGATLSGGTLATRVDELRSGMYRVRMTGLEPADSLDGKVIQVRVKRWDDKEETFDVPVQVRPRPPS